MRLVLVCAGDRVIVTEVMPNGMFAPVNNIVFDLIFVFFQLTKHD